MYATSSARDAEYLIVGLLVGNDMEGDAEGGADNGGGETHEENEGSTD